MHNLEYPFPKPHRGVLTLVQSSQGEEVKRPRFQFQHQNLLAGKAWSKSTLRALVPHPVNWDENSHRVQV